MKNVYTLTEQVKDNIQTFGHFEAAKIARKKIPFTLFHFFAFGKLPRAVTKVQPIFYGDAVHATYKTVAMR